MIACAGVATAPVHGRSDQALRMALALHAKGSTYALHVYANDGHGLPLNRADRIQRIVEWFSKAP
jgi:dipeptidyl aminopeptidase/acylaminoacyl peptidase